MSCAPTEVELSPSVESITSTTTSVSAGPTSALSAFGTIPSMSGPAAPTSTSLSPTLPTAMPLTIVGTVTGSTTGTIAPAPCSAARHREAHARRHLETRWPMLRPCRPPRPMSRRALHPEPFSRRRSTPTPLNTSNTPAPSVMPTPNTAACSESIFDGPRQSGSGGVQHEWQCCRHAGRVAAYGMLRRLFSLERTFWDSSLSRLPADHRRARRPGQAFRFASAALNACRVDRASGDKLLSISADCRHGHRCRPAAPRASWNRRRRGGQTSRDGGRIHRRRARCSQDGRAPRRAVYAWGFSYALAAVVNIVVAISAADKIFNIVINLLHSNTRSIYSVNEVRIDAGDPNARLAHSPSIRCDPLRILSDPQPRAREPKLETAIHQAAPLIGLSSSSEHPGPTASISSSAAREQRPGFLRPGSASG
ncbi:hypothetical protein ACVWYH_005684 [Bradyrhizobium sp. GM24.11]